MAKSTCVSIDCPFIIYCTHYNFEIDRGSKCSIQTEIVKIASNLTADVVKTYQQSKSGMWHKVGGTDDKGNNLPKCQSYNLDRPNILVGKMVDKLPEGAKVCKKCCAR